jgi:hypothetical protein
MIGTALRLAGQRLLPIVAPAGGKAFAKEAARTGALSLALEQGLPLAMGREAPPLPESLMRAATLGALSGPIERGIMAGVKSAAPGISQMEAGVAQRMAGMGVPTSAAQGLAGAAAGLGKLGLGVVGGMAVTEPLTRAVTRSVLPEGYGGGRNTQTGVQADITGVELAATPEAIVAGDPAALEHQRRLELTYARNYKFPSQIYHISQGGTPSPFEIANQMLSTPTTRYF